MVDEVRISCLDNEGDWRGRGDFTLPELILPFWVPKITEHGKNVSVSNKLFFLAGDMHHEKNFIITYDCDSGRGWRRMRNDVNG